MITKFNSNHPPTANQLSDRARVQS